MRTKVVTHSVWVAFVAILHGIWILLGSFPAAAVAFPDPAPQAVAPPEAPEEEAELPPPLTHYRGRQIAQTMSYHGADWLTRDEREKEEHCQTLLDNLHLAPGQVVCDLGCGNGYYSLRIAELVKPKGRVLAVDIQSEMLRLLEERAKETNVTNVKTIQGTVIDPRLPTGALDLVLMVDVYHELSYPEQVLAAVRRSLKPEGRLVLVEFRAEDPLVPIKPLHKMSKAQVLNELLPNGFKLVEQFDKLPWQHVMFFQADPDFVPGSSPAEEAAAARN